MPNSKINLQVTLIAALRVLLVPCTTIAMLVLSTWLLGVRFTEAYVALSIIAGLLTWICMGKEEPRTAVHTSGLSLAGQIGVGWLGVVGALLLIGYATKSSDVFSRRALFLWFLLTPAVLTCGALGLRQWLRMALISSRNARTALIVGASKMSVELARIIHDRPELGLKLRCMFDERPPSERPMDPGDRAFLTSNGRVEIRDDFAQLRDYVNKHRIDVVFIALPTECPRMQFILSGLRDTTSSVYLIPDLSLFDLIQAQSTDIQGVPVVALCESPLHGVRALVKRATDVVLASLVLLLALPVMVAIALAIKLTSPGRVLFKQDRYGLDGERIVVYKFRTMRCRERRKRRAGDAQRFTRHAARTHPPAHVARRAAAADQRAPGAHEPRGPAASRRGPQRAVSQADLGLHGSPQGHARHHRSRAGQRLSRRDVDARGHGAARRLRPRVSAALVLVAGPENHGPHGLADVSGQARVLKEMQVPRRTAWQATCIALARQVARREVCPQRMTSTGFRVGRWFSARSSSTK
jgi:hypothetical protein